MARITRKVKKPSEKISIPALRGRMGDWFYYISLLKFSEVANRVYLPEEIDEYQKGRDEKILGEWIQRDLQDKRIHIIVDYLLFQGQRFFNSLILGIYEGSPSWQDLKITVDSSYDNFDQGVLDYMSRSFGVLTLNGDESIFAIDGQHRAVAIREAIGKKENLKEEEVTVIFVAHHTDSEGKIRTRRLFSTLNKYAKPVSQSEIIALSEDNNCAIITRRLVEEFDLLKDRVLFNKNRSINPENKKEFTNIMVLYDIVEVLLCAGTISSISVSGKEKSSFTTKRASDEEIKKGERHVKSVIKELFECIPSLSDYTKSNEINRNDSSSNLVFRPIGQNVVFDVLKVAIDKRKKEVALNYFRKDDFNLKNKVWKKIFWEKKTNTINTEASRQRFATMLILEHLGFDLEKTDKDLRLYRSFKIDASKI